MSNFSVRRRFENLNICKRLFLEVEDEGVLGRSAVDKFELNAGLRTVAILTLLIAVLGLLGAACSAVSERAEGDLCRGMSGPILSTLGSLTSKGLEIMLGPELLQLSLRDLLLNLLSVESTFWTIVFDVDGRPMAVAATSGDETARDMEDELG